MDTRKVFLTLLLFVIASPFSMVGAGEYPYLPEHDLNAYRSIASSVWAVKGSMLVLETEERTMRSFGVKEWAQEGFMPPKEGDEVTLTLDRGNTIIDITESGGKGGFFDNQLTGKVHRISGLMKWIVLETDEGDIYGFDMKDAAATKLNWIQEGRRVTLAMDGQDRVMDAYRAD